MMHMVKHVFTHPITHSDVVALATRHWPMPCVVEIRPDIEIVLDEISKAIAADSKTCEYGADNGLAEFRRRMSVPIAVMKQRAIDGLEKDLMSQTFRNPCEHVMDGPSEDTLGCVCRFLMRFANALPTELKGIAV